MDVFGSTDRGASSALAVVRGAVVLALGAWLWGCGPREVPFEVRVVPSDCSGVDPGGLAGVRFLHVSVTGPGLEEPVAAASPVDAAARRLELPPVPAGVGRVAVVRGFDGDPAASSSRIVSIGRSVPFTVPESIPPEGAEAARRLTVFLRRLGALTPLALAADPSQCVSLAVARAAHTATRLTSGKVFLAGGFTLDDAGAREALADVELFEPGAGAFERGPALAVAQGRVPVPRAFHTATHLGTDQVLLWGGEYYSHGDGGGVVSTSAVPLLFDPEAVAYGVVGAPEDGGSVERTQHAAAVDANGTVLLVGGLARQGVSPELAAAERVQWFDPSGATVGTVLGSSQEPLSERRVGAAAASVDRGRAIAVVGGGDGARLVREVAVYRFEDRAFLRDALVAPRLVEPGRRAPLVVAAAGGRELVVLGGHGDAQRPAPLGTSEIIDFDTGSVRSGPPVPPVVDGCAVGLSDGSIFLAGGRALDGGLLRSRSETALLRRGADGAWTVSPGPSLPAPRHWHTCTLLADGTVLIAGGMSETAGGAARVAREAWVYQPEDH